MNKFQKSCLYLLLVMLMSMACSLVSATSPSPPASVPVEVGSSNARTAEPEKQDTTVSATSTVVVPVTGHLMEPASDVPRPERIIDDVESSGTGPEGRAPYGDSYPINRFERPFLQDMTYVSDMDIHKFSLSRDADWYYVSIQLIGKDPNNSVGINYGVELDLDGDGFGDYMIWASPPYLSSWDTRTVQIYQDADHDTAGVSSAESDAVFSGNGYDSLFFDGKTGQNEDPDLAWVRMVEGDPAIVQFAFKRSLASSFFMIGVVSDAGLRDVTRYDYADYFSEAEAGSPVSDKKFFPLGSVYSVDNTCWEAYGQFPSAFKPKKVCQQIVLPTNVPSVGDDSSEPNSCTAEQIANCGGFYDPLTCDCLGGSIP